MNIRIGDCGHLGLLNGGDAAFWMENENRNVLLVSEAVNCSAERVVSKRVILPLAPRTPSCISTGRPDHGQLLFRLTALLLCVPPGQEELE